MNNYRKYFLVTNILYLLNLFLLQISFIENKNYIYKYIKINN